MTDDTTTDKPLATLVHAEDKIDRPVIAQDPPETISLEPGSVPSGFSPAATSMPAPARLRAYEDALFGADCVRIRGQVERGYGSKFKAMTEPQAAHYAALEILVVAEQTLADAHTALIDAENAAQTAADVAEKTEAEIDGSAHE